MGEERREPPTRKEAPHQEGTITAWLAQGALSISLPPGPPCTPTWLHGPDLLRTCPCEHGPVRPATGEHDTLHNVVIVTQRNSMQRLNQLESQS